MNSFVKAIINPADRQAVTICNTVDDLLCACQMAFEQSCRHFEHRTHADEILHNKLLSALIKAGVRHA